MEVWNLISPSKFADIIDFRTMESSFEYFVDPKPYIKNNYLKGVSQAWAMFIMVYDSPREELKLINSALLAVTEVIFIVSTTSKPELQILLPCLMCTVC